MLANKLVAISSSRCDALRGAGNLSAALLGADDVARSEDEHCAHLFVRAPSATVMSGECACCFSTCLWRVRGECFQSRRCDVTRLLCRSGRVGWF